MITYPIAKINLGLNIVERRSDGYHNIETIFYPIPLNDALELHPMDDGFPHEFPCDLKISNMEIDGNEQQNLVVKAYNRIRQYHELPPLHIHLYKGIPTQAGMGGGSSDAAYMITLLNKMFSLGMSEAEMMEHAHTLGADCPFFIQPRPAYAEGIGERLTSVELDLTGLYILIVQPNIHVSTKEAFSLVTPQKPKYNCKDVISLPIHQWKEYLVNDFESSVFAQYPQIGEIKQEMYDLGAVYAAMTGSGSCVYGLFLNKPNTGTHFTNIFQSLLLL